jgi:uncharacterized protein
VGLLPEAAMENLPSLAVSDLERTMARRGLTLFFPLVIGLTAVFTTILVTSGKPLWIYAVMWSVAAASVITRLLLREGFADVSFRFGGRRTLVAVVFGLLFPVAVGAIAFGTAWVTGLALLDAPVSRFLGSLALAATVGSAISALAAAGEEIGWRGYMLTRLITAGVPRPVLVSGLVWGLWHLPLILVGFIYADHPSMLLTIVVFMVSATSGGIVIAKLRLVTGSIWPAIALHAAYNSVIQSAFTPATSGEHATLWVGEEAGVLVALTLLVAAVLAARGRWTYRSAPGVLLAR